MHQDFMPLGIVVLTGAGISKESGIDTFRDQDGLWNRVNLEEVATLESERGKGLAQSVMLAALEAAQALEPELIFLSADADDWPKLMYERLGFETVGTLHVARRNPEPEAS